MFKLKIEIGLAELCGWVGMIIIQSATIPVTVRAIFYDSVTLPPIDMVLMMWAGLWLYLIRAIAQGDKLYMISNSIGVFLQTTLLFIYWLA